MGYFVGSRFSEDPEENRRARLLTGFGLLGSIFGAVYAAFYFLIAHYWGAGIIVLCSIGVAAAPWIMRSTGSLALAANLFSFILTLGFTALCGVEGGMYGHAMAWLVTVPLCALLLAGKESGRVWVIGCFAMGSGVVAANFLGLMIEPAYEPSWHSLITAAGYLGLILFMFLLGMIFESGRRRAFGRMQQALRELEVSNERLVHLNQEKNEFLGIAAHDLKNPLTSIIGNAEMIALCKSVEQTGRFGERIVAAGTRMRDLISNLLDAAAIEEGRFSSNIQPCDLAVLLQRSVEHNQGAATRKQIEIAVEPQTVWANADEAATLQILDNLLSNALKYSPPKTRVRAACGLSDQQAWVSIQDQGPGISEEDQKKMFGKFMRLSARPTAGESSNGLGLSIVKRLAESMQGTVVCRSRLGEGSTFILHLPRCEAAAPSVSGSEINSAPQLRAA